MRPPRRITVTGHRTLKDPAAVSVLLSGLLSEIQRREPDVVATSGMALGADLLFAEEALKLKIPLTCALPHQDQVSRWPPRYVDRWRDCVRQAHRVVRVWEDPAYEARTFVQALFERNRWMLDQLTRRDVLVAVWDGRESGGTWSMVKDARARGLKVLVVDPS